MLLRAWAYIIIILCLWSSEKKIKVCITIIIHEKRMESQTTEKGGRFWFVESAGISKALLKLQRNWWIIHCWKLHLWGDQNYSPIWKAWRVKYYDNLFWHSLEEIVSIFSKQEHSDILFWNSIFVLKLTQHCSGFNNNVSSWQRIKFFFLLRKQTIKVIKSCFGSVWTLPPKCSIQPLNFQKHEKMHHS